jgi:hypothetical protein
LAVLTGKNGALRWNGATVGKVRSWSLSVNKDALETTNLGVNDRTYVTGLRGSTGTADLMYDPTESQATSLLNSIFSDDAAANNSVSFVLDTAGGKNLSCTAFITAVSPSVSVGEIQVCSVSFQVTGSVTGGF